MHEITDEELEIAKQLLEKHNTTDIKILQKKMKIGYVKAKTIMDIILDDAENIKQ